MTGENSKHSNMPAKPVHTPHVRTTSTCRRTSSVRSCPYNSEISLMELNGIPRFDVLCRKLMTLRYKEESPTPAVLSKTAASLLRTTLTSIVSTCMPPRKPVYFTMWS